MTRICKDSSSTGELVVQQTTVQLVLPNDIGYKRAFIGALALMTNVEYWVEVGNASPEQSVQFAIEVLDSYVEV